MQNEVSLRCTKSAKSSLWEMDVDLNLCYIKVLGCLITETAAMSSLLVEDKGTTRNAQDVTKTDADAIGSCSKSCCTARCYWLINEVLSTENLGKNDVICSLTAETNLVAKPTEKDPKPCCSQSLHVESHAKNGNEVDSEKGAQEAGCEAGKGQKNQKVAASVKKCKPVLSEKDITAVRTVQLVSFWYIFCIRTSVILHFPWNVSSTRAVPQAIPLEFDFLIGNISSILIIANSSCNFFFHLRGATFRATFRSRLSRYLKWTN